MKGGNSMRKVLGALVTVTGICLFVIVCFAEDTQMELRGEAAFNEYCLVCHPGGGNIFNEEKTLHKKDLEANNIRKAEDIVKLIRNPGPHMTKFDENTIPDDVAKAIAEYILKNIK
jgi:cytochrome c6